MHKVANCFTFTKTKKPILLLISSISIQQIKYIVALSETGSFSEAAEQCFVTQSTLSTMIKKMETEIDLKIFDRSTKPIRLTHEGQHIIKQCKQLLYEYGQLQEVVQQTKQEFHGSLSIGIIPTLAPFLLPLFLDDLVTKYPGIDFRINEITTQEITSKILSRDLDLGILSTPLHEKGIMESTLFNEEFLIYDASENSRKAKKYSIDDLDIDRMWLLEESHCMTQQIEKICHLRKKRTLKKNLMYKSGSFLSLLQFVHLNKGLTLLPRLATLQSKLIDPNYLFPIAGQTPVREIGIVFHPNFSKDKMRSALEEEILQKVRPYLRKKRNIQVIQAF